MGNALKITLVICALILIGVGFYFWSQYRDKKEAQDIGTATKSAVDTANAAAKASYDALSAADKAAYDAKVAEMTALQIVPQNNGSTVAPIQVSTGARP